MAMAARSPLSYSTPTREGWGERELPYPVGVQTVLQSAVVSDPDQVNIFLELGYCQGGLGPGAAPPRGAPSKARCTLLQVLHLQVGASPEAGLDLTGHRNPVPLCPFSQTHLPLPPCPAFTTTSCKISARA